MTLTAEARPRPHVVRQVAVPPQDPSLDPARRAWFESLEDGCRDEWVHGKVVEADPLRIGHIKATKRIERAAEDAAPPGSFVATNNMFVRLAESDYFPDVCYWPPEVAATFTRKQTIMPPPLFAVEVLSPKTARRDRGVKFEEYAAGGTREYWIVDCDAGTVEQYASDDGGPYRLLRKVDAGVLRSEVIDGFEIDVASIFA